MSKQHGAAEPTAAVDVSSAAFASRFAALSRTTRRRSRRSLRAVARSGGGRWSRADLKAVEAGSMPLDDDRVESLALLYGLDVEAVLPERTVPRVSESEVVIGGIAVPYDASDPDSLYVAYLELVRELRSEQREAIVHIRRSDVETLAAAVADSEEAVISRLGALMGVTRSQQRALVLMLASGAVIITIAGGVIALSPGTSEGDPATPAHVPPAVAEAFETAGSGAIDDLEGFSFGSDLPSPVVDTDVTDDGLDDDADDTDRPSDRSAALTPQDTGDDTEDDTTGDDTGDDGGDDTEDDDTEDDTTDDDTDTGDDGGDDTEDDDAEDDTGDDDTEDDTTGDDTTDDDAEDDTGDDDTGDDTGDDTTGDDTGGDDTGDDTTGDDTGDDTTGDDTGDDDTGDDTDDEGLAPPLTAHIYGDSVTVPNRQTGRVDVSFQLLDDLDGPIQSTKIAGAVVEAAWEADDGTSGTITCTTNGNGGCNLRVSGLATEVDQVSIAIVAISKDGSTYDLADGTTSSWIIDR
jgi:hypothetical protein